MKLLSRFSVVTDFSIICIIIEFLHKTLVFEKSIVKMLNNDLFVDMFLD